MFGLQEPASVVFSVLNLYAHITMYLTYKKTANRHTPMFYIWSYFSVVNNFYIPRNTDWVTNVPQHSFKKF